MVIGGQTSGTGQLAATASTSETPVSLLKITPSPSSPTQPTGWITLLGGVGTGKTHLLAAVANALMYTTARPLYCVVPEFLAFLRESFDAGQSESCSRRFELVRNAGVLLLDDLGAEKESEWTQEQLYRVINHRYNEGLPTLIASNLPLSEIEPRIASRLRDTRIGQVIVMSGPDYRARTVTA